MLPPQKNDSRPDCFKFEPTMVRRMSSRIPDIECIKDELEVSHDEGQEMILINGSRNCENDEMFSRSMIVMVATHLTSNQILAKNVTCLTIKTMGGLLHLIIFDSFEDKRTIFESKWLERWFFTIKNVNDVIGSLWREIWKKIMGYLLSDGAQLWKFYKVGCMFAKVLLIDYWGFDCAKVVCIITGCLLFINCKILMKIDGKCSRIS